MAITIKLVDKEYPGRKRRRSSIYPNTLKQFMKSKKKSQLAETSDIKPMTLYAGLKRAQAENDSYKSNISIRRSGDEVYLVSKV